MWLALLAPPCCAACGERLRIDAALCAACLETLDPPPRLPAGTTAAFAFGGALVSLVHAAKYRGRGDAMRAAERLVRERLPPRAEIDCVVPVGLHRTRLAERGFDQAARLATAVGEALEAPVFVSALTRLRSTAQLAKLDAHARRAEVEGAFVASPRLSGQRVLLVDDVHTTGATLRAAASAVAAVGGHTRAHVLAATVAG